MHHCTRDQRCASMATGLNGNGRFNETGMGVAPIPLQLPLVAVAAAIN